MYRDFPNWHTIVKSAFMSYSYSEMRNNNDCFVVLFLTTAAFLVAGIDPTRATPMKLELLSYPSELTQHENSEVLLNCTADGGYPKPKVIITRDGDILATGTSPFGVKITLTKLDNQAAFICKATSPGIVSGMTSRQIQFNVIYAAGLDPSFNHQEHIITEYNRTVAFSIHILANPIPNIAWSRAFGDNYILLPAKAVVYTDKLRSILIIPFTSKDDMSIYMCAVRNTVGKRVFLHSLTHAENKPCVENEWTRPVIGVLYGLLAAAAVALVMYMSVVTHRRRKSDKNRNLNGTSGKEDHENVGFRRGAVDNTKADTTEPPDRAGNTSNRRTVQIKPIEPHLEQRVISENDNDEENVYSYIDQCGGGEQPIRSTGGKIAPQDEHKYEELKDNNNPQSKSIYSIIEHHEV